MRDSERMSGVDRAWLLMERPTNPMMVVGLLVLDEPLSLQRLRNLVTKRFLSFERFRFRPHSEALAAHWVRQADFAIEDHVVCVALPGAAGKAELQALAGELASTQLSPERPMWSFHLVEKYGAAGSAVILRIHHCYADGIALTRVLLSLTDPTRRGYLRPAQHHREGAAARASSALFEPFAAAAQLVSQTIGEGTALAEKSLQFALHPFEAAAAVRHAADLAGELTHVGLLADDPPTCLKQPLSGVRHVAWTDPLPLDEVRTIAHVLGCTINDVLVATLAGALGRYLRTHDRKIKASTSIRAAVPVNLRTDADTKLGLGNQFGLVFVDLPVGIRHPLQRLYAVRTTMLALKGSPQALVTFGLLALIGALPAAVEESAMALFSAKASLVASNVPGPRQPLYLGGAPVAQTLFWVPQAGSIGTGISMLTYNGTLQFGVMSDRALIAHPGALAELLQTEFEQLLLLVLMGAEPAGD